MPNAGTCCELGFHRAARRCWEPEGRNDGELSESGMVFVVPGFSASCGHPFSHLADTPNTSATPHLLYRGFCQDAIASSAHCAAVARTIRLQLAAQWSNWVSTPQCCRELLHACAWPSTSAVEPSHTRGAWLLAQTAVLMQRVIWFARRRHFPDNLSAESARVACSAAARTSRLPATHFLSRRGWSKLWRGRAGGRGSWSVDRG